MGRRRRGSGGGSGSSSDDPFGEREGRTERGMVPLRLRETKVRDASVRTSGAGGSSSGRTSESSSPGCASPLEPGLASGRRLAWSSETIKSPRAPEKARPQSMITVVLFVAKVYAFGLVVAVFGIGTLVPWVFVPFYQVRAADDADAGSLPPVIYNNTWVTFFTAVSMVPGLFISALFACGVVARPPPRPPRLYSSPRNADDSKPEKMVSVTDLAASSSDGESGASGNEGGGGCCRGCCWSAARRQERFPRWRKRMVWALFGLALLGTVVGVPGQMYLFWNVSPSFQWETVFYLPLLAAGCLLMYHVGVFPNLSVAGLVVITPMTLVVVGNAAPTLLAWYRTVGLSGKFFFRGGWQFVDVAFSVLATTVGRLILTKGVGRDHETYLMLMKLALSFYGRLIISEAGSLGAQILLSSIVALLELGARLTLVWRENFMAHLCACCNRGGAGEAGESILMDPRVRSYLAGVVAADMLVEVLGIVLAPAVLVLFHPTRYVFDFGYGAVAPALSSIAIATAVQLALEAVVDIVCVRYETQYLDFLDWKLNWFRLLNIFVAVLYVGQNTILSFMTAPESISCAETDPCACGFPLVDALCP